MGRRGGWFDAVKRVFSPEPKEKKVDDAQRALKSKKKWSLWKSKPTGTTTPTPPGSISAPPTSPPITPKVELSSAESDLEQNKNVYSAALATAQAAAAAAQAAAEVVRLTASANKSPENSREEAAALKIQTAFRGYLAKKVLRALRGLNRLEAIMNGDAVKRQARTTLHCMQTLSRVQVEVRSRRVKMTEDNQALQRHLQLKLERELEAMRVSMGEDWDDSVLSKEQIEASIINKHEAAMRRERAMAYAFTHQWKSASRSLNTAFIDPSNPQWGWSWLERWLAARSYETQNPVDKDHDNGQSSGVGEITKSYARRNSFGDRHSPAASNSTQSVWSFQTPPSKTSTAGRRVRSASSQPTWRPSEDDLRSLNSVRSERSRRYSVASSSIRDDESYASSPAVPNYMSSTESARAKSRFQSPSRSRSVYSDNASIGSVKKRLSYPAADKPNMLCPSGARRHSVPPKMDVSSVKEIKFPREQKALDEAQR